MDKDITHNMIETTHTENENIAFLGDLSFPQASNQKRQQTFRQKKRKIIDLTTTITLNKRALILTSIPMMFGSLPRKEDTNATHMSIYKKRVIEV